MEGRHPSAGQQVLAAVVTLATLAVSMWAVMPEWQRRLAAARARAALRAGFRRLAARSGEHAMGVELAGCDAGPEYAVTERLSRIRDAL